jgi:hypothetical protein
VVLARVEGHPPVQPDPGLGIKDRARRGDPHQQRDQHEKREEEDQAGQREQDVHHPPDQRTTPPLSLGRLELP